MQLLRLVVMAFALCLAACNPPSSTSLPQSAQTETHNEPYYTQLIAAQYGWQPEVRTPVGTRCDLVTPLYAVEVEWPRKCFESVGQALHYSVELQKEPCVLFLLSGQSTSQIESEREYVLERVGEVCDNVGIEIWWYDTTADRLVREIDRGK